MTLTCLLAIIWTGITPILSYLAIYVGYNKMLKNVLKSNPRLFFIILTVIPQVKVTNQLVGAPIGSDVELQCYIEASPKAMNSWYREDGTYLPL